MDVVLVNEVDLNFIVKEYLDYLGYLRILFVYEDELNFLGKQLNQLIILRNDLQKIEIQDKLLLVFVDGRYVEFFRIWEDCIFDNV